MTTRITPPTFLKSKNYELCRQELTAWREITDLSKDKQGIAIALSLPEVDESQIKVFDQIPVDDLISMAAIKVEPTFLTGNEEALLATGYSKGKGWGKPTAGKSAETWKRGRSVTSFTGREFQHMEPKRQTGRGGGYQGGNPGGYQCTESGSQVGQPSVRDIKNISSTGPDGRTLTCKSCGSYRHLLPACPDSWENMAKIHIAEKEHAVLFTGYDTGEVRCLGIDAQNCSVLDSA